MSQSDIKNSKGDIHIGNNVWIGASVFITEGVEIGDNAVIGANSVVTRDIPPHTIAAGVPAKVQKFKSYTSDGFRKTIIQEQSESINEQLF
ncbi:DapH/DapD/GlmU-related protein [Halopenitus sp. POP-27]|uniref:DapH/DapD/GlmU-related protein n=1 Tax=Halopenitus sp. POP-27 TaxID=2994425 RepID=UPI0024692DAD|nr:DapH/DapD/GlmU-related protein [Halopenitus sp. POP-27]